MKKQKAKKRACVVFDIPAKESTSEAGFTRPFCACLVDDRGTVIDHWFFKRL